MGKTVVFTVSKSGNGYNIKSAVANRYNKNDVPASKLFDAMEELTDIFNNVIGAAILFEID